MSATQTRDRPIMFSAPMARAILEGRKTQTRRIIKPQWPASAVPKEMIATTPEGWQTLGHSGRWWDETVSDSDAARRCPFGVPGDQLWVRESWCQKCDDNDMPVYNADGNLDSSCCWYRASNPDVVLCGGLGLGDRKDGRERSPWKPSIHMPRWASRVTLEVVRVRVERLHDIGKDGRKARDVLAEGIDPAAIEQQRRWFHPDDCPALAFGSLWESINGKGSWAKNPWVWVVEFKRKENAA